MHTASDIGHVVSVTRLAGSSARRFLNAQLLITAGAAAAAADCDSVNSPQMRYGFRCFGRAISRHVIGSIVRETMLYMSLATSVVTRGRNYRDGLGLLRAEGLYDFRSQMNS